MTLPDIHRLIPQREPVLMVDRLLEADESVARTVLTVRPDNYFVDSCGVMAAEGVIEHMAQSASALAGYKTLAEGASGPPLGFIGEVKKFRCLRAPRAGEELHTTVSVEAEAGGVTLVDVCTYSAGELLAGTKLKISVQQANG